jgi:hypothetical protein
VVISRNDASVLLYNESTRRALAEGRIIIAIDQEGLSEQLAP